MTHLVNGPAAAQPRTVDRVVDAVRRDNTEMCKEVGRVISREAAAVGAAQVDTADQLLAMRQ